MVRLMLFACAVLAALSFVRPTQSAEKGPLYKEQLIYEITVTDPGTRSQGWHGTLYDEEGHAMQIEVGKRVMTEIGELVSVAGGQPWTPYGMIPTAPGMKNIIMRDPWSYKLYRTGIGSKCTSWRGEMLRGDILVNPQAGGKEVQTSMGPFIWLKEPYGWIHKSWKVKAVRCG